VNNLINNPNREVTKEVNMELLNQDERLADLATKIKNRRNLKTKESCHKENLIPKVQLPKLVIAPFQGDISDWPNFWAIYSSAVHSVTEINDVLKFKFLLGCIKEMLNK
jgi:Protein of unknown function (DUF1759)